MNAISAWESVFRAHLAGSTLDVVITATTMEGGSANGIRIGPGEREQWMSRLSQALDTIGGSAADGPGLKIDFSLRRVQT